KFSEQSIDDDSYIHDFLQQRGRDVSLPPPCGLSLKGATFKKNGRKKQKGAPVGALIAMTFMQRRMRHA
ncbi:MAG: hypothetical protein ACRDC6_11375, partial [Shewanella sp.]